MSTLLIFLHVSLTFNPRTNLKLRYSHLGPVLTLSDKNSTSSIGYGTPFDLVMICIFGFHGVSL